MFNEYGVTLGYSIYLPELIVIADGGCWKQQTVFVFHADVNVFRIRQEMLHFIGDKECEQTDRSENYQ